MPLITLRHLSLAFGGPPLLDGIDLTIERGDRLCLLGRNGSGKSSLLKVLAGEQRADAGEIFHPQEVKVALVSQEVPPELGGSVFDVVSSGVEGVAALLAEYHQVGQRLAVSHANPPLTIR